MLRKTINIAVLLGCVLSLNACGFLNTLARNYTQENYPRFARLDQFRPKTPPGDSIKVVSYNIMFSKKLKKAEAVLKDYPQLAGADILCLQEMNLEAVHDIAQTLEYNYIYYPAVAHPLTNDTFGNAVLSKWPIIDDRKIILPSQRKKQLQRIAVGANIIIGDTELMVYSAHFDIFLDPFNRRSNISRMIHNMPPNISKIVIAGDFNTFSSMSKKAIVEQMKNSGFEFVTEGLGWTHKKWFLLGKKSSVDHIFVKGFQTVSSGKIEDRTGSDHLPIWAILKRE